MTAILPQFHHCDCGMCEWLNFGTFLKFPCIVRIYAWFFMHCRNYHSDSHANHVIIVICPFYPHGLAHGPGRVSDTAARIFCTRSFVGLFWLVVIQHHGHLSICPAYRFAHGCAFDRYGLPHGNMNICPFNPYGFARGLEHIFETL